MKSILNFSTCLLCAIFILSCQSGNDSWQATYKGNFSYKIINNNTSSEKPDTIGFGDVVSFHYVLRNGDSIIESSYITNEIVELELPAKPGRNEFMEALTLARQGDSLLVKIKYEDALEDLSAYAQHFKSGDFATFAYKIVKVESRLALLQKSKTIHAKNMGYKSVEEMDTERNYYKKAKDSLVQVIKKQIATKNGGTLPLEKSPEGIAIHHRYLPKTGRLIEAGDTVFIVYMGLVEKEATIFDDIFLSKGERLKFVVADSNFKAPMLHKSVQLLQNGSKATIFVPSELGYGPEGSGKRVPPNANLVLYLDIVAVHPKQ
jgi:FKBP-type peptidyl-prolyl cis-trans isomerase FkpA